MSPDPMPAEALEDEQPRESLGTSGGTTALRTAAEFLGSSLHRLKHTTGFAGDRPPLAGEDAQPRGLVLRPALLGFVAVLAVSIGASLPSSPFKLEMPGVWFFGEPSSGGASRWGVYFALAAVYGGLLLFMRVWWGMTRLYSRCPGVAFKKMMWVFALWSLPVLVIAPLFSRDAYSYAAQGEMVSHHMNPYLYGPFELGNNSYTAPVDSLWGNAPAPYGPLFLQIDGFFARITFHNALATIVLLRLLAFAGVLLIAACVPRLARLYHRDGAELFTLMVLNPVTIFHLIGGAHNDALMLGLLVAGLTAAKEKRPIVGIVLCALATVLGSPGAVRSWTAPTMSLALITTGIAHFVHIGVGLGGVLSGTRLLGLLVAGVCGVWLLFNSDRIGTLKALGITLLLFVVLGPVVQPWYLSWGLILLAPVALGRLRSLIIGLSMVTAFIELPGATHLLKSLLHGDPLLIALTLLWILVVLTVPLATWERTQPLAAPSEPSPRLAVASATIR
jgi:hypothetical protein